MPGVCKHRPVLWGQGPQAACPALLPAFPTSGAETGRWCHQPGSCSGSQFPLVPSGGWRGPPRGWRGGLGGSVQGRMVTVLCLLPPPPLLRGQDPLPELRASVGGLGGQDQCRERGAHPEDIQQGEGPRPQPARLLGDPGKSPKPGPAPRPPQSLGRVRLAVLQCLLLTHLGPWGRGRLAVLQCLLLALLGPWGG